MNGFVELTTNEMYSLDGGCVGCKIGGTLVTVGAVIGTGVNPVSVVFGIAALYTIWG